MKKYVLTLLLSTVLVNAMDKDTPITPEYDVSNDTIVARTGALTLKKELSDDTFSLHNSEDKSFEVLIKGEQNSRIIEHLKTIIELFQLHKNL